MHQIRLVVFDLAGTTVEDKGQVVCAFREALAEHNLTVTPEQLQRVRGASKKQAVLDLVPEGPDRDARGAAIYATFRKLLEKKYTAEPAQPIEQAQTIFRTLRQQGIRVALNTGFDREITNLLLNTLEWAQEVDAVVCGDDVSAGRPAPYLIFRAMEITRTLSVQDVVNIGDTALDLEAGHNAGVYWNAGVLSGAHDRKTLERAPHTHIWPSIAEFLPSLKLSRRGR